MKKPLYFLHIEADCLADVELFPSLKAARKALQQHADAALEFNGWVRLFIIEEKHATRTRFPTVTVNC